jgi:hypothetical protein
MPSNQPEKQPDNKNHDQKRGLIVFSARGVASRIYRGRAEKTGWMIYLKC